MSEPLRLITIPISHYCEKARWALDRAGVEFREEPHLQVFHHYFARRAGGGLTTPVLRFPDGHAIGQSSEILTWADTQLEPERRLYPEELASRVRAIEHWLDVTLGPDGRGWMYKHVLQDVSLIQSFGLNGIPEAERRCFSALIKGFGPYFAARMRVQGTNPDLGGIRDVFDEIGGRLADGRAFIFGDRFTAADLTFAALSAPLIVPEQYGYKLPPLELFPPAMQQTVREMRKHPAGEFALRMFATERQVPVAAAV
ncbi:MAG: glutathione S-transferase family protein [Solirubrobacterales bacterium]